MVRNLVFSSDKKYLESFEIQEDMINSGYGAP